MHMPRGFPHQVEHAHTYEQLSNKILDGYNMLHSVTEHNINFLITFLPVGVCTSVCVCVGGGVA